LHERLPIGGRAVKRLLHGWIELGQVEVLAGVDANALHTRQDWLVGDVRLLLLQQLGRDGEILVRRHRIDLNLRRRLHVDRRVRWSKTNSGTGAGASSRLALRSGA
jgi:hypothetical protein